MWALWSVMKWLSACALQSHYGREVSSWKRAWIFTLLWTYCRIVGDSFFSDSACNYRRASRWEEAILPHPIWALQLQDGVERTGSGDGVHCWRTVSEIFCHFFRAESLLKYPPAWVSSSHFVTTLSLIPGQPLKSPGPKWAAISPPSENPSCTTRGPFALWTCRSRTQETTAARPRTGWARSTTPSASRSTVCQRLKSASSYSRRSRSFCRFILPPPHNWFMHRCQQASVFSD